MIALCYGDLTNYKLFRALNFCFLRYYVFNSWNKKISIVYIVGKSSKIFYMPMTFIEILKRLDYL